jgi:hypothetical protein
MHKATRNTIKGADTHRLTHHRSLVAVASASITLVAIGVTLAFAGGGVVTRTNIATIAAHTRGSATAKCPRGRSVALGGFRNTIAPGRDSEALLTGLKVTNSGHAWKDSGANDSMSSAAAEAVAYCGQGRNLTERTKAVEVPAATGPATKPTSVTAKCPRGRRVALGGIAASFDPVPPFVGAEVVPSAMKRTTQRGWKVSGLNLGSKSGAAGKLTAIAYCAKTAKTTERSKTVTIPSSGTPGSVTAKCHQGEKVAFGGFKADATTSDAFVLIDGLERVSSRLWAANAINEGPGSSAPGDLTAFAYCT